MKPVINIFTIIFLISTSGFAQKYITKNGNIGFYSEARIENIEAYNNQVNCALDIKTGDFVFKVLIKSFEFQKALMQEHFNENYLESDKYPASTFIGKVTNIGEMDLSKNGSYKAKVEGDLIIHGITKKIAVDGTFNVKDGKINGKSRFNLKVKDFDIKIPAAKVNNIAETIEVRVDVTLSPLK